MHALCICVKTELAGEDALSLLPVVAYVHVVVRALAGDVFPAGHNLHPTGPQQRPQSQADHLVMALAGESIPAGECFHDLFDRAGYR